MNWRDWRDGIDHIYSRSIKGILPKPSFNSYRIIGLLLAMSFVTRDSEVPGVHVTSSVAHLRSIGNHPPQVLCYVVQADPEVPGAYFTSTVENLRSIRRHPEKAVSDVVQPTRTANAVAGTTEFTEELKMTRKSDELCQQSQSTY